MNSNTTCMGRRLLLAAALTASMVFATTRAGAAVADLVLLHGKVYTAAEQHPWAQAVAIAGGKIIAVGSDQEVAAVSGPATRVLDLHGHMLMPGLVDSHAHPIAGGRQLTLASVDGKPLDLPTFQHFVDSAIADGSALHGDRVIIVGVHPSLWSEDLGAIFNQAPYAQRPILFAGEDAHTGWANQAMLAALGLSKQAIAAMPPDLRRYFRVDARGEPTGFAMEAGASRLFSALPGRHGEYAGDWGRRAVRYYNERGVTAVLEANAGSPSEDGEAVLNVYRDLATRHELTLHVSALLEARSTKDLAQIYALRAKYSGVPNFAIVGVKLFADGVLEYPAQTAATLQPYRNSGKSGVLKIDPVDMNAIAVDADRHGMIVHIHAIGDRAVREALNSISAARVANPGSRLPHTIAHLQLIDPKDIPRFAQLGAIASFQLLWASFDEAETKLVKPYLAPAVFARQYPAKSVHDSGGVIAGGSDWPVTSGNPWEAIAQAMTRDGPFGVLGPEERLPLVPMLQAYTIDGARALRLDGSIGSIETGKDADLVLLDRDVTAADPREIALTRPMWTMVHGEIVYRNPQVEPTPPGVGVAAHTDHYRVLGTIAGPDGGWDYASFDPTRNKLYVSRTDGLMAVDVASRSVTPHLVGGSKARGIVLLQQGALGLVIFEATNEAVLFKTDTAQVLARLPMPPTPDGAVSDPRTGLVYVMSKNGEVTVVDPRERRITGKIEVGGELEAPVVDQKGRLFVNVAEPASIAVIDLASLRVIQRHRLSGCEGPTGLAYISSGNRLMAACENGVAKVIAAQTGRELGSLETGAGADSVLFDARRGLAFIPSGDDAMLTVIQVGTDGGGRVAERLHTRGAAATGALDPVSGQLFLPSAQYAQTPPPKRSAHEPGTFAVLVLGPASTE